MRLTTIFYLLFGLVLLIYLIMPGPTSVYVFPELPNSHKSNLDGDTWQVYNLVGFFSNNYRNGVIAFYDQSFRNLTKLPFGPIHLNYPPEFAYTAIKDQTQSTFLEEQVYPLRDSLFINGMEPLNLDRSPRYEGAMPFEYENGVYDTKTTIRYYPSFRRTRLVVWAGIMISIWGLWRMTKKVAYAA
jgi:hypothetical protein